MPNNLSTVWGRRIKHKRLELGMSQRALAARAEIDQGYFCRIENGETGGRGVGDEVRMRLARALGVRVEDIFSYPEITDPETTCPSAAPAVDGAPSPTPATAAATRSPAPNAAAPGPSAPEENPATEIGGA